MLQLSEYEAGWQYEDLDRELALFSLFQYQYTKASAALIPLL